MKHFLLLLLLPSMLLAETCVKPSWSPVSYSTKIRGEVYVYQSPEKVTLSDLYCAAGSFILSNVSDFPKIATIGVVSPEKLSSYVVQWDLERDIFGVFMMPQEGAGIFVKYPEPKKRLAEIILQKNFPKTSSLPIEYQRAFKVQEIKASQSDLEEILHVGSSIK